MADGVLGEELMVFVSQAFPTCRSSACCDGGRKKKRRKSESRDVVGAVLEKYLPHLFHRKRNPEGIGPAITRPLPAASPSWLSSVHAVVQVTRFSFQWLVGWNSYR